MRRFVVAAVAGTLAATGLLAGPSTIPLYENFATLTNMPQVDAVAFANYGTFVAQPPYNPLLGTILPPYETLNTLYYTNRGEMVGAPGFRFDYCDDWGFRRPADSFYQANGAFMTVYPNGMPSVVRIDATNLVSRGTIGADTGGLIELRGVNVDISRCALEIQPILNGSGFQSTRLGIYYPDEGIYDLFWGMGEQDPRFSSCALIDSYRGLVTGYAPPHCTTNQNPGYCGMDAFYLNNPASFVYTNAVTETNWIIQVALVGVNDTNLSMVAKYSPSSNPTNAFTTVTVQIASYLTNVAKGRDDLVTLFLRDSLASETNVLLTNMMTGDIPYRCANYELTRNQTAQFARGRPTNAVFRTNLSELVCNTGGTSVTNVTTNIVVLPAPSVGTNIETVTNITMNMGYATAVVTNEYSCIGAFITNVIAMLPDAPGASITNAQGRIEVWADNLNMERTRIRAEGHVSVGAKHLITSSNAAVDVSSIFYNFGSTNGTLRLQSLTLPEVQRYAGYLYAWSAVWTNQLIVVTNTITNITGTNVIVDPADPNLSTITNINDPGTNYITTNTIEVGIHVMFVDASLINTRYPTFIHGLETHATNLFVGDTMRILEELKVDAESLTVNKDGRLLLGEYWSQGNTIRDWKAEHFPNLRNLTNHGVIGVPDVGNFGGDMALGYASYVNTGTNGAFAHKIKTDEFENSGLIATAFVYPYGDQVYLLSTVGSIELSANRARFEGGVMNAGGDIEIIAHEAKLRSATNVAAKSFYLNVSDVLTDSGWDANNLIRCGQGVHLRAKPHQGALLGTKIQVTAPDFDAISCTWAAEDRGATADGYVDNAAVGRLALDGGVDCQIVMSGTGNRNAMYVDFLEIGPGIRSDLQNQLVINPSLTIYFSTANISSSELTNTFPGRVVWVGDFAGPNSSSDVVLPNGRVITIPRGVRESIEIDSDGDGIANAFDLEPFDIVLTGLNVTQGPPPAISFQWGGVPDQIYTIEYSEDLGVPVWRKLTTVTSGPDFGPVSSGPLTGNSSARFYRVRY